MIHEDIFSSVKPEHDADGVELRVDTLPVFAGIAFVFFHVKALQPRKLPVPRSAVLCQCQQRAVAAQQSTAPGGGDVPAPPGLHEVRFPGSMS